MPDNAPAADQPKFRYDAARAAEIELSWQERWVRERHLRRARTRPGLLSEGFERVADRPKLYVLDMFPYPSGTACTSVTRSASSAPTCSPATSG